MQPTSGLPFLIGQVAVAYTATVGLYTLFGLGLSYALGLPQTPDPRIVRRRVHAVVGTEMGDMGQYRIWIWPQPEYARRRIRRSYLCIGGTIFLTAAAAASIFQSQSLTNLMMKISWRAASIVALLATEIVLDNMPYSEGFGAKQLGWVLHCGLMGMVYLPIFVKSGLPQPLVLSAVWLTAGVAGGLSAIAILAPTGKFFNWESCLEVGDFIAAVSYFGSSYVRATTALGAGLHSIFIYGGIIFSSGLFLCHTQRLVMHAEVIPANPVFPYDPIRASMSISLCTADIFIRIAYILAIGSWPSLVFPD